MMNQKGEVSHGAYLEFGKTGQVRRIRDIKYMWVKSIIDQLAPKTIVDVGAADCAITARLANCYPDIQFTAVDRSGELLAACPNPRVKQVVADARRLPLKTGSVELVLMIATFKHIFRPAEAMSELYRTLCAGGHILIIEPSTLALRIGGLFGRFDLRNSPNIWTPERYADEFGAYGFSAKDYGHFPFPGLKRSQEGASQTFLRSLRLDRCAPFQFYLGETAPRRVREDPE